MLLRQQSPRPRQKLAHRTSDLRSVCGEQLHLAQELVGKSEHQLAHLSVKRPLDGAFGEPVQKVEDQAGSVELTRLECHWSSPEV